MVKMDVKHSHYCQSNQKCIQSKHKALRKEYKFLEFADVPYKFLELADVPSN